MSAGIVRELSLCRLGEGRLKGSPPAAFCYLKQGVTRRHKWSLLIITQHEGEQQWAHVTTREVPFGFKPQILFLKSSSTLQKNPRWRGDLHLWVLSKALGSPICREHFKESQSELKDLRKYWFQPKPSVILCFPYVLCSLLQRNLFQQS